jgi:hypothetical protein
LPGRGDDCRAPDDNELKATTVLGISLHEASAKIRNWGPRDYEQDTALPFWAGVLPLSMKRLQPVTHEQSHSPVPDYVQAWLTLGTPAPLV